MFRNLVVASAMLALDAGSVCHAEATVEVADRDSRSLAVSLAGLNLNTTAGAKVALTRIRLAARQLCGDEWSRRTIGAGVAWKLATTAVSTAP